jgi:ComF family protein
MYCRGCGVRLLTEENSLFCPDCWESSPRIERPFCSRCGKPHTRMTGLGERSNFPCLSCREHPNRYIQRIWGAAYYDGAVGMAIRSFKFNGKIGMQRPLAELMIEFARMELNLEQYDCLVPVPLYKTRLRDRGFNQSLCLAQQIAPEFPHAVIDESLQRIRPTRAQSTLKSDARSQNVRGAFAVMGNALEGKQVLLIDDVITTGDTITECARALMRAGALKVDAFAVALACPTVRHDL